MATLEHEPKHHGLASLGTVAQEQGDRTRVLHQCAERLADLRLRGVEGLRTTEAHVLAAPPAPAARAAQVNTPSADQPATQPARQPSGIAVCERCPVCRPAAGRFVADASALTPGRLLVVLEFPGSGPDAQTDLANPEGANHLIERLLLRAGLRGEAAFSYALRGVPKGAPQAEHLSVCSSIWLASELAARQPEIILCFGPRAESALAIATSRHGHPAAKKVLNFPSAHELKLFPEWRQDVWRAVSALTAEGA